MRFSGLSRRRAGRGTPAKSDALATGRLAQSLSSKLSLVSTSLAAAFFLSSDLQSPGSVSSVCLRYVPNLSLSRPSSFFFHAAHQSFGNRANDHLTSMSAQAVPTKPCDPCFSKSLKLFFASNQAFGRLLEARIVGADFLSHAQSVIHWERSGIEIFDLENIARPELLLRLLFYC